MYLFTAWFRNPRVLAKSYALRRGEVFLSSEAGVADGSADSLPRVPHGVEVSDEHIGW